MTIRKEVQEVRLDFSLSSQNGTVVSNFKATGITIYQDDQPVPALTSFSADQNLPVHVLLMIDASDSMTRGFAAEQSAAVHFLKDVVRPGLDRSAAASFSTHVVMDANDDAASSDTMLRISSLHASGITALYESLYESAAEFRHDDKDHTSNRRVIVLLSDGVDNYSLHSLDSAIAEAQRADLVIYAIAAHDPHLVGRGDAVLDKITSQTGGRFFVVKKFEQSASVFSQIEQEIRSQYSVTFRPPESACGYHSLRVEVQDPSLHARSRSGFYASCQS